MSTRHISPVNASCFTCQRVMSRTSASHVRISSIQACAEQRDLFVTSTDKHTQRLIFNKKKLKLRQSIFERVYLVPGQGTFVFSVKCLCASTPPTSHSVANSRFFCLYFHPRGPSFFEQHDLRSNLAESRYPRCRHGRTCDFRTCIDLLLKRENPPEKIRHLGGTYTYTGTEHNKMSLVGTDLLRN